MKIRKMLEISVIVLMFLSISFSYAIAQSFSDLTDCLVTNDIGKFTYKARNARLGNAAGVVGDADHFKLDHVDSICNGSYSNISEIRGLPLEEAEEKSLSVKVQVTQHTGGDSDKWLLHEMDTEFRNYYGIPDLTYTVRSIDGNTILVDATGGRDYRWLSGNKVIIIEYNAQKMSTIPEPLEVVKAYLAKHPSSILPVTLLELRGNTNVTKWIKDEIERRLWLCDKWNANYQAGKATQQDLLYNLNRSLGVFLNYRQKYYGVSAKDDLAEIEGYIENKNVTAIVKILTDHKTWWAKKKEKRIYLH